MTNPKYVTPQTALEMIQTQTNYKIIDVRTPEEYKTSHIKNAINIPNETIHSIPPQELPDLNQLIFVYCQSGMRSSHAATKLANQGYTNIIDIGGITTWKGETTS